VLLPVDLELLFLSDEAGLGILKLPLQELVGFCRQPLPVQHVLVDEQRREPFGHLHHRSCIVADEGDGESRRVPLGYVYLYVGEAHSGDDVLHDLRLPFLSVKIEIADDLLEPPTAENLRLQHAQPLVRPARDRRLDVVGRYALPDHFDGGDGAVLVGQVPANRRRREADQYERYGDQPLPSPYDVQVIVDAVLLAWNHVFIGEVEARVLRRRAHRVG
jgi:hypothetical protein